MKCPNCNHNENDPKVEFCCVCGTRLVNGGDESLSRGEVPKNTAPVVQSYTVNGVSFNMIRVKGGSFMMGVPDDVPDAYSHKVTLDDYSIGETPVTMELWNAVMGEGAWKWHPYANLNYYDDGDRIEDRNDISPLIPVSGVNWEACKEFIDELSLLTGANFRFPTGAEWEFAAKGGNQSRNCKYSGTNSLLKVGGKLHEPVKMGIPNELGIFDMSANVSEWCFDWYHNHPNKPEINPRWDYKKSYETYKNYNYSYDYRNSHMIRLGRNPVYVYSYVDIDNRIIAAAGLRVAL